MSDTPSAVAVSQILECMGVVSPDSGIEFSRVGCGEGFVGCLWRGRFEHHSFIAKTIPPYSGKL